MAKRRLRVDNDDVIVAREPVILPTMPLERTDMLSEVYPDLFPNVQRKHRRNIPVKLVTIIIVLLAVAGFFIYYFNSYVSLLTAANTQIAQIDSELQRRADLVPNLVQAMETYTVYENQLVSHLAEVRSESVSKPTATDGGGLKNSSLPKPIGSVEEAISKLLAIVERYPDLKASATFQTLMTQLAETEDRIAEQRAAYNRAAMAYNNKLNTIPGCFLRYPFRLNTVEYFEAGATVKKLPIVELDFTQLETQDSRVQIE